VSGIPPTAAIRVDPGVCIFRSERRLNFSIGGSSRPIGGCSQLPGM
jgi:hypothetical protein